MLRCSVATLFRSWLASLAVGLRTLASQVRAQRHSRIACDIVFRHRKILRKKKFASFFCSYVVSELARFTRDRIEDSSFNRFALNGIQRDFFGEIFFRGDFCRGDFIRLPSAYIELTKSNSKSNIKSNLQTRNKYLYFRHFSMYNIYILYHTIYILYMSGILEHQIYLCW